MDIAVLSYICSVNLYYAASGAHRNWIQIVDSTIIYTFYYSSASMVESMKCVRNVCVCGVDHSRDKYRCRREWVASVWRYQYSFGENWLKVDEKQKKKTDLRENLWIGVKRLLVGYTSLKLQAL